MAMATQTKTSVAHRVSKEGEEFYLVYSNLMCVCVVGKKRGGSSLGGKSNIGGKHGMQGISRKSQ